jgi:hypothetical protein
MVDVLEARHIICPTKDEERRDYTFAEDGE